MKNSLLFILSLQLLAICSYAQQSLVLKGRSFDNEIVLRWAPTTYDIWKEGNENGYTLLKIVSDENGEVVDWEEFGPFQPLPESDWGPLIEEDNYAGLAYNLLYLEDTTIYDGVNVLEQYDMEQNRFGFCLFAADVSLPTAFNLGLGYRDTVIQDNYTYTYRVSINDETTANQSLELLVDPDNQSSLPSPDSLMVNFGDQSVEIIWERANLDEFYSAYYVEYKIPGIEGNEFVRLNEFPYVYMIPEKTSSGIDPEKYMIYRDTLEENFKEYTFRIRGLSIFGELGPPSNEVSGSGKPKPLPVDLVITSVQETVDQQFEIDWIINDLYQDSIVGFNVYRSTGNTNQFLPLNGVMLSSTMRGFTDLAPEGVNYYQIEAIDVFNNSIFSTVNLGQLNDTEPPLAPVGLTGFIDTTGLVILDWDDNTEQDLLGYHVYFNNGPEGEFAILTSGSTIDSTGFIDSIAAQTLSEKIYYRIRAIDFSGNQSIFSEPLELDRPDLVPPVEGQFKSNDTDRINGVVEFTFVNSTSSDVVLNELQRKELEQRNWTTVLRDTTQKAIHFVDKDAYPGISYQYRIRSVDDVGHITISDTLNVQTFEKAITDDVLRDFNAKSSSEGIVIAWVYETKNPIRKIVLFRAEGRGPMRTHKHLSLEDLEISGNIFRYIDKDIEKGIAYQYQLLIRHENDQTSPLSPQIKVGR